MVKYGKIIYDYFVLPIPFGQVDFNNSLNCLSLLNKLIPFVKSKLDIIPQRL
jgi:hypothetical protein